MINKEEFENIRKEFDEFDKIRELIIKESRDILKLSKQAIFSVHRGDFEIADEKLKKAEEIMLKIRKEAVKAPETYSGSFRGALEEYSEAKMFYEFLKNKKLPKLKELNVSPEQYLGGLADFTGEIVRKAVLLATEKKTSEVKKIRDLVDDIYGQFVQFDFRNGDLRKKYDSIKYNLQKVENFLYDLSMSKSSKD